MIKSFKNFKPDINKNSFTAENSTIIGNVSIKEFANIWYGAVLRGDVSKIEVGANSNIQDNAVVHGDVGSNVLIGNDVTIGHSAIIHGCTIQDNVLIGMGSIILNDAVIEEGAVVGAGALVPQGKVVPKNTIAIGNPLKILKEVSPELRVHINKNKNLYVTLGKEYKQDYSIQKL